MAMRSTLKKAFEAASRLPGRDQDRLAESILDEIVLDEQWDRMLAESQDALQKLADEALAEHKAGSTKPLDPDKL